jgi:hypothetical protein
MILNLHARRLQVALNLLCLSTQIASCRSTQSFARCTVRRANLVNDDHGALQPRNVE